MAAARERTVDGARDRKHLAPGFPRQARGDERAAVARGLDHQRAERKPADDAVAPREVLTQRRGAWRELRHQRAADPDTRREALVLLRIDAIEAGAAHGHRESLDRQRPFVAGSIDAERQSAGHGEPGARKPRRELMRRGATARRGAARADHGELRGAERRRGSEHIERRGRAGALPEQRRIVRVGAQNDARAARGEPGEIRIQRRLVGRAQKAARGGGQLHLASRAPLGRACRLAAGREHQGPQVLGAQARGTCQQRARTDRIHAREHKAKPLRGCAPRRRREWCRRRRRSARSSRDRTP